MTGASESWKEPSLSSFFATNAAECINAISSYLNDLGVIVPPATAVLNGFVGVVDTEQNAIGTNLVDRHTSCGSGEVSAGRDLDVLLEIVIDSLLSHDTTLLVSNGPHDIFKPVVDIPEVEGNVLALVKADNLQLSGRTPRSRSSPGCAGCTVFGEVQRGPNQVLALRLQLV
jgi:hypothetical protein